MAYRRTKKYSAQRQAAMQAGRQRAKMEAPAPGYPAPLPELRMRITVERLDFGHEQHVFELRKTRRVDTYAVYVDGKPWKRSGLSGVLEGIRKACPRVMSQRALYE